MKSDETLPSLEKATVVEITLLDEKRDRLCAVRRHWGRNGSRLHDHRQRSLASATTRTLMRNSCRECEWSVSTDEEMDETQGLAAIDHFSRYWPFN